MPTLDWIEAVAPVVLRDNYEATKQLPDFCEQFASTNDQGHIILDGKSSRNPYGMVFVRTPEMSDAGRAQLIMDARSQREASARRAMIAAGLSRPAPKPSEPAKIAAAKPARRSRGDEHPKTAGKSRTRGPSNPHDFEFFKRRERKARVRAARMRGDYLTTSFEPTFKPKPSVKFRPASAADLKVSIGPLAWSEIVRLTQIEDGDRETGGALVGAVTNGTVRVIRATGPGMDAVQTESAVRTRVSQEDIDAIIAASKADLSEIGSWHSHPYGLGEPSKADMESLVNDKQVMGIEHPVMLIVRPDHTHGWAKPTPAAWILTQSTIDGYDYDVKTADIVG